MIEDVDRIMDVMAAAFDPQWGEAWNRNQVSSSLAVPTTHYRLIGADGKPPEEGAMAAGFSMVRAAPGEEELLLIGVKPDNRGGGIGWRLLELFADDARKRGAERIFLEMRENNPAISLYHSFGFNQIGRRPRYYKMPDGNRIDAITYGMNL